MIQLISCKTGAMTKELPCPITITPTGRFEDCVGGHFQIYRIEPHVCPKCKQATSEFASEYAGLKAAQTMVALAARQDYKCCLCLFKEARDEAKEFLRNKTKG